MCCYVLTATCQESELSDSETCKYAWNIQLLQPKQKRFFYRGNIDLNCNFDWQLAYC